VSATVRVVVKPSPEKMGTGRIQNFGLGGALAEGVGDGSPPAGSRGRAPVGVWGRAPKPEECYVMRLKKATSGQKKTSPYRLTLYDNIIDYTNNFWLRCN